jgi:hypothetical protein
MNLHPDVFVFPETHWIPKMYEFLGMGRGPGRELASIVQRTTFVNGRPTLELDPGLEEMLGALSGQLVTVREFCDALGSHMAGRDGKRCWADKTPDYGPHMELLQRLWPNARFIHLVRDGIAVARSMAAHPGFRWLASAGDMWWATGPSFNGYHTAVPVVERPLGDYLDLWARRLRRIRDEATRLNAGTYLEVRYEDLCRTPARVLDATATFVGLEAYPGWVNAAAALIAEHHPRRPVLPDQLMTPDARTLMRELGYTTE